MMYQHVYSVPSGQYSIFKSKLSLFCDDNIYCYFICIARDSGIFKITNDIVRQEFNLKNAFDWLKNKHLISSEEYECQIRKINE